MLVMYNLTNVTNIPAISPASQLSHPKAPSSL